MGTIRRYGSRKLYDLDASSYVSLEEIAERIRGGEEIEVLDNDTGGNVTGQTLVQILLEESRSGRGRLPAEILHDVVRVSGRRPGTGARHVQSAMNRLMRTSLQRLAPIREVRRDVARVDERLRQLEETLETLERRPGAAKGRGKSAASGRRRTPSRTAKRSP